MVSLCVNTTKAPLNDPKVRQAISYGINRQQLSPGRDQLRAAGHVLERPAAADHKRPAPVLGQRPVRHRRPRQGGQILTSDGYTKIGGKWIKNGQTIKFSIEDPSSYSDYSTDAQLIANQLNAWASTVTFDGVAGRPSGTTTTRSATSTR